MIGKRIAHYEITEKLGEGGNLSRLRPESGGKT